MRGRPRWVAVGLSMAVLGGAAGATGTVSSDAPADVATYRGGPGRTGVMPGPAPEGDPVVAWEVPAGAPVSAMALVDGVVHVATLTGEVLALDLRTGERAWSVELGDRVEAPILTVDGQVLVPDMAGTLHARATVDGTERWAVTLDGSLAGGPTVVGDQVLIGTTAGTLVTLDVASGAVISSLDLGGAIERSAAVDDGTAYVGAAPGALAAVSLADGEVVWRHTVASEGTLMTPAILDDTVMVSLADARDGVLEALDAATGTVRWRYQRPANSGWYPPIVTPEAIVVASNAGRMERLDPADGRLIWSADVMPGLGVLSIADATILGVGDAGLVAVDIATGATRWTLAVRGTTPSVMVSGGTIVIGTSLGQVIAITGATA